MAVSPRGISQLKEVNSIFWSIKVVKKKTKKMFLKVFYFFAICTVSKV